MSESLIDIFKQLLCRFLGHRKSETWEFEGGTHTTCKRCGFVYTCGGFYRLRNFKDAHDTCKMSGYIYRKYDSRVKAAKNHNVHVKKRVKFIDRISKDWVIND